MAGQSLKHSSFFHSVIAYLAFGFYTFVNFTAILRDGLENRLTYFESCKGKFLNFYFSMSTHCIFYPYIIASVLLLKPAFRGSP